MSTHIVTPSLMVGDVPRLSRATRATTAEQAAEIIRTGRVAVLPRGRWDEAERALAMVEVSSGRREALLGQAKTGSLL